MSVTKQHETRFEAKSNGSDGENSCLNDGNWWSESRTKLLVSVRDLDELRAAIVANVDVIDLKEPQNGPLSPVDPEVWRMAAQELAVHLQSESRASSTHSSRLSAALGETSEALLVAEWVPSSFAFAKVGPSGCDSAASLRQTWQETRRHLNDSVALVAVAYADWDQARCIEPAKVFEEAARFGIQRCLVDTFHKDGRSTLDHMGEDQLRKLAALAEDLGIWWTLAGSIKLSHLADLQVAGIKPNCIGVRGDVCDDGRGGKLNPLRMQSWQRSLSKIPN